MEGLIGFINCRKRPQTQNQLIERLSQQNVIFYDRISDCFYKKERRGWKKRNNNNNNANKYMEAILTDWRRGIIRSHQLYQDAGCRREFVEIIIYLLLRGKMSFFPFVRRVGGWCVLGDRSTYFFTSGSGSFWKKKKNK